MRANESQKQVEEGDTEEGKGVGEGRKEGGKEEKGVDQTGRSRKGDGRKNRKA